MDTSIRVRSARSRSLLAYALVMVMLVAGQAVVPAQVSATTPPVDVVGTVTEERIASGGGCEIWTLLLWADFPGAVSYTIDMHDSWGYSFVATFPPYQYDGAFGGLPAVGAGQHRHALTYQGGAGDCSGGNYDVARFTILSFVANFADNDGRIVGTVTDDEDAGLADVPISISGTSSSTEQTNAAGAYGADVTKGSYTVSAPAGYCVRGGSTCSRSKTLDVQGPTSVHFVKSEGTGTISGSVTERTCTEESCTEAGLPGVLVSATGPEGGDQVTAADGTYSITVGTGTYEVTPSLDDREFDPTSRTVEVDAGDSEVADFATCAEEPAAPAALGVGAAATECEGLRIDWTMPSHIRAAGWNAAEPSDNYINPKKGWKVNLFLKDAAGNRVACAAGRTWTWKIKPRGTGATTTYANKLCRFSPYVPREGVYTVTVEERRTSDGRSMARGTKDVIVQDFLIIGLGDSNGSGQANPPYANRQCDRSEQSYQMRAAEYVEKQDDRTSVTFVHVACSGARTVHIADKSYVGQEPGQGGELPPQLWQVRRALKVGKPVREIDAMILSAGINDLRFGGIVSICLENALWRDQPCQDRFVKRAKDANGEPTLKVTRGSLGDGRMKNVVAEELVSLPARITRMAKSMAKVLKIDSKRVLMTTYPDEAWRTNDTLCDASSGYRPRLTTSEWRWLAQAGAQLNRAVRMSPFTSVDGIPALFRGHGYCTRPGINWFRSIYDSLTGQWNPFGTFHATNLGHLMMSLEVIDVLCPQLFNGSTKCQGEAREPAAGGLP